MITLATLSLSATFAATERDDLVGVTLCDVWAADAVKIDGELWIPALALDASLGDALALDEELGLTGKVDATCGEADAIEVTFPVYGTKEVGVDDATFAALLSMFDGATVEGGTYELGCPVGVYDGLVVAWSDVEAQFTCGTGMIEPLYGTIPVPEGECASEGLPTGK